MNESFAYLLPDHNLNAIQPTDEDFVSFENGKKKRKIYENCQYDQHELQQIQQFRNYAQPLHDFSGVPDQTILRYLYSFDFNNSEALEKLKIYLQWYSNPKIQKMDSKTLQLINNGFCYTYGRDKDMRPVIYMNAALIDMQKYSLEDYLSATNAIITLVIQKLYIKGKLQNYLFIIDTQNKNFSSLPLSMIRQMTLKLSYVYSMRMGKLLVINCNYLIKLMYSAISPFLAEITRKKTILLSTSEIQQGKLTSYIDINQLEHKYGGSLQNLVQKWPPQIPGQQTNKKAACLHQLSLHEGDLVSNNVDGETEYFSCQNDPEMFYKLEDKIVATDPCCSNEKCIIY